MNVIKNEPKYDREYVLEIKIEKKFTQREGKTERYKKI